MTSKSSGNSKLITVSFAALLVACPVKAGSLWREDVTDERGIFADKRAKRVGDILTLVVQETVSVTNTLKTTTSKESSTTAGNIADTVIKSFTGQISSKVKELSSLKDANISTSGKNSYTGGGDIKNTQTITTRAAVQVIDVLPNGNLVVEGLREISFSKERQFAALRGIVRGYDVLPDNTVLSSNVADARIEIVSEGTLTDAQKKGWLLRLNDKVNPF
jgi:flagellar L-ring protein precursor FlgH